jgi:hypothetical protein
MTDLYGDTLAGPSTGEQRARAVAGWAGRLSLIVVVAGTVVIVATGGPTGTFWPGFLLVVAGLALALGSLVHGRIRAHERGRGFAVTPWWSASSSRCSRSRRTSTRPSAPGEPRGTVWRTSHPLDP